LLCFFIQDHFDSGVKKIYTIPSCISSIFCTLQRFDRTFPIARCRHRRVDLLRDRRMPSSSNRFECHKMRLDSASPGAQQHPSAVSRFASLHRARAQHTGDLKRHATRTLHVAFLIGYNLLQNKNACAKL
jgi:hypothetical protein